MLTSSAYFEPKGSSSGRQLYIQVWYSVLQAEITIKGFYKISKYTIFELFKYIDVSIHSTYPKQQP
jgi:hypothetical protein